MYQFERFIGDLKKKVRNKARVEAAIVEAYLVEEATLFLSLYFRAGVRSARNKTPRYDENGPSNVVHAPLISFNTKADTRTLKDLVYSNLMSTRLLPCIY